MRLMSVVQIMYSAPDTGSFLIKIEKTRPKEGSERCKLCIQPDTSLFLNPDLHGVSNSFARKSAPDPSPGNAAVLQRLYGSGKSASDPSPGSTAVLQRLYGNGSSKSPGSTAAAASIKSLQQPSWDACRTPSTSLLFTWKSFVSAEKIRWASFVKNLIF